MKIIHLAILSLTLGIMHTEVKAKDLTCPNPEDIECELMKGEKDHYHCYDKNNKKVQTFKHHKPNIKSFFELAGSLDQETDRWNINGCVYKLEDKSRFKLEIPSSYECSAKTYTDKTMQCKGIKS